MEVSTANTVTTTPSVLGLSGGVVKHKLTHRWALERWILDDDSFPQEFFYDVPELLKDFNLTATELYGDNYLI